MVYGLWFVVYGVKVGAQSGGVGCPKHLSLYGVWLMVYGVWLRVCTSGPNVVVWGVQGGRGCIHMYLAHKKQGRFVCLL